MAFKIKDGMIIDTTPVFDDSATLLVNAPTATKLQAQKTISLTGDVTGSVNTDFSGNVSITTTLAGYGDGVMEADLVGDLMAAAIADESLVVGQTYKIAELGDTDWNAVAGTTGVTYAVGDTITVAQAGAGTGTAHPLIMDNGTNGTDAEFYGNAATASAWETSRTVTFATGDVTGSFSIDGSANVSDVALTIQPDSVALGTDTTGDYVASVGVTADTGLSISGTGEGATVTIAGVDASTTVKGVASFSSDNFAVTSGAVTIKDGGVANAELANSTVTFGTTEVALGASSTSIAGVTQLDVDNVRIDGNVISTTNTDGDLTLTPNGSGNVVISSAVLAAPSTFTIDPAVVGDDTGTVIIAGNLTVNGTTTTINSTIVDIGDSIVLLNSAATGIPTQNAGIEVERGDSTNVSLLWDEANDRWTIGTQDIEVGTVQGNINATTGSSTLNNLTVTGTLSANSATADKWATARTVTFATGDVTGSFSIDGSANVSDVALTIQPDSVALGTDTTGNYVADVTVGTGLAVSGTAGEGWAPQVALSHLGFESLTDPDADRIAFWDDTAGAFAWLQLGDGLSITDTTLANTQVAFNTISVSGQSDVVADQVNDSLTFAAGNNIAITTNATTDTITVASTITGDTAFASVTDTVATTSADVIDSFAIATYRSAKYVVQITQGTNYQVSEIMAIHDGSSAFITEYAILETNGTLGDLSAAINGANLELSVTMAAADSASIKIKRILVEV